MNKLLGQHFLKNRSVTRKIIEALHPTSGDVFLEIGPGHGELTIPLAEQCSEFGCKIIAIEKDGALADQLAEQSMKLKTFTHVEIIKGDALKILPTLAEKKYKLFGNIPYYLTGHLLRLVSELADKPERCVLMVQKEVAERILAQPPKMNRLAASVQFWANVEIIGAVPKSDFVPPPKVDSAILLLKIDVVSKPTTADHYYAAVRTLFAQPRKTILNNLAANSQKNKEDIAQMLQSLGILPSARPQNLDIENIVTIAHALV